MKVIIVLSVLWLSVCYHFSDAHTNAFTLKFGNTAAGAVNNSKPGNEATSSNWSADKAHERTHHLSDTGIQSRILFNRESLLFSESVRTGQRLLIQRDSSRNRAVNTSAGTDDRVIIASGDNALEFTPWSSFNGGAQIEPINRNTNTGVSTAFYLRDTASWAFYTNDTKRLEISGNGETNITALMINNASPDGSSVLRVNGSARVDSMLLIRSSADSLSFISLHRAVRNGQIEPDDGFSPYTSTPVTWAQGKDIPVFRLRHPNSIVTDPSLNTSLLRDFMILPYQYGMAIEYNGVVECWVGEWSIHKGLHYNDTEGKGNGWGGVLWVGDDIDAGGLRATARNNTTLGGNVAYSEISTEKFGGDPNGDLRLRLPSTQNSFQFVYGERGSTNIIAKLNNQGLIVPRMGNTDTAADPEKGQIVFETSSNYFKFYDGSKWTMLSKTELITGSFSASGNGLSAVFLIPHGLGTVPSYFNVVATSLAARNISHVTADATFIEVHYEDAPEAGANNLSWNWQAKQ